MDDDNNVSLYGEGAITSGSVTDHDIEMVRKASGVEVRDGDDLIEVDAPEDDPEESPEGNPEEGADKEAPKETPEKEAPKVDYNIDDPVLASQLAESDATISQIGAKFTEAGIDVSAVIESIRANGITKEVLDQAAKAGVEGWAIKAVYNERVAIETAAQARQEAAQAAAADEVYQAAGGRDGFKALAEFAGVNTPELAEAFNAAAERGDVKTAKVLLKAIEQQRTVKLGTANKQINGQPTRSASVVQGFADRQEMTKAINDSRYASDARYRASVEQRIIKSTFF